MSGILVVQTAFLGDLVLTGPLLAELRRVHPHRRITVVTTPAGPPVVAGLAAVDRVEVYDKRAGLYGLRGLARVVLRLRRSGPFDVAIAAQRSMRSGFLVALSGARRRVGFEGAPGAWAYTDRVAWTADRHSVDRYLALAAAVGGEPARADRTPSLALRPEDVASADAVLRDSGVDPGAPLTAIAPGSAWPTKRWTPEGFAAVARDRASRGDTVVLLGTAREVDLCETVRSLAGGAAISLAGRLDVGPFLAVVRRSDLLVANDSGAAHVAAAVGTPVVAVFGPTTPELGYAPRGSTVAIVEHAGLECRPCHRHGPRRCPLGHFRCMRDIGPDRVIAAAATVRRNPTADQLRRPG